MQQLARQLKGDRSVATLITSERLNKALEPGGFLREGSPTCVEGAKYDFRMSPIILKASFGTPVNLDKLPEDQRAQVKVEPSEVVFVRTIEKLALPNDIIAMLSPKRRLSHQGIIALGGFAVDPKYVGPLFVGLYNVSSTPFHIQPGKKLIAAMFYQLADTELTEYPIPEPMGEQDDFPDELITLIKNYKPVELKWVADAITETQRRLDALSTELHDDRSWKQEFKESLDRQSNVIDRILKGLEDETIRREKEDDSIKNKLDRMSGLFTAGRTIMAIILIIITAIVTVYVEKNYSTWVGQIKSEPPNEERQRLKVLWPAKNSCGVCAIIPQ
jgi:deoxycytidine triphosphate deaminase